MTATAPRTLKIVTGTGGQPGSYELAVDPDRSTLDTAVRVAKLAEAARFDFLFTADLLRFDAQGAIGSQEPLIFVAALSQVTSHIGLIATVSTTFHHPFNYGRPSGLPWIFSSFHATYGATEAEARRNLEEHREAIDDERGRAQVEDMLGGGVDLSEAPLDQTVPESLLPDVRSINGRRGRSLADQRGTYRAHA